MFKWVWLVILGLIWLVWFCVSMKDVVITVLWSIKNKEIDFYKKFEDGTYIFLCVNIVALFFASLFYWAWSL